MATHTTPANELTKTKLHFGNIDTLISNNKEDKSPWAKTLIKHIVDLERQGINARASLQDLVRHGRGYTKNLLKRDLITVIYLQDLKEHFKQVWSYRLNKYLYDERDMLIPTEKYPDGSVKEKDEFNNWSWFWENMNLVFENVFMNKIMEHITRQIQNPEYMNLEF